MCLQVFIHAFRTFDDRGGGANDPVFSVDLARSRAIFRDPEILYIIRVTCCTSQGDPDSSFPYGHSGWSLAWDHFRGSIDDPCGVIADFRGVIADFRGVIADA